ncbi:MAG TPA: GNAT family N-acetyltransferase [Candidatus Competibacter sp.]|nr:GNAT family N-acetyltransferase [Candidatus Competibacter sp.]
MPTRHLQYLFDPASVALIGASERPGSLGAALTRNVLDGGFGGELFLVNRRHRRVRGMLAYPHPADLPGVPELVIVATPAPTVPKLLAELGQRGTKVAVIATPSGRHGADETRGFHRALRDAAQPHGLRLLGPDSLGIVMPHRSLNASLVHLPPRPGHLALIAQSGAVLAPLIEWATAQGIGFSRVVALGERVDIDFGDLLDWLAHDPDTQAILLYLETLKQARPFLSAARVAARIKPVLAVRAGRGGDAVSHRTDAIYDAAFRRAGMLRVASLRELFWAAETLALDLPATGDRLAIVGNSRGLGLLAADTLLAEGGRLARFGPAAVAALRPVLYPGAVLDNPLDLGGDAGPARFAATLNVLLEERDVDGVLVLNAPNALIPSEDTAAAVIETVDRFHARNGGRPSVLTCWLGADSVRAARQRFLERRIPAYDTPNDAIRAFVQRWRHQQNRIALMETPPDVPELSGTNPAAARHVLERALATGRDALDAAETAALLQAYGIALAMPDIATPVRAAGPVPLELAIRAVVDPVFGPALLLGPGGRAAVPFDDTVAALPPLNPVLAREMIAHAWIDRLLRSADAGTKLLDEVVLLLVKLSQLIVDLGEVIELELNPVLVGAAGVTASAARIRIAAAQGPAHERLAIRPYPRELEETLRLPDGSTLLVRPVRPEDEPAFVAGFARLTTEDVRMRFMHVVKKLTHDEAARLTQIDYDREMALVAWRQRPGQAPASCGVARLTGDPDREERAELAIVLLREATGIGLSSLLLRRLVQYARARGIREVYGEILRENEPMLELCRAMGFTVEVCPDDAGVMIATLPLA